MKLALALLPVLGLGVEPSAHDPMMAKHLSDLKEVPLSIGMNRVPNFTDDGQEGWVVKAWNENGNAWGHTRFLIMIGDKKGPQRGALVEVMKGGQIEDTLSAQPHTGEDVISSVRLARGRLDGRMRTLLFMACRHIEPGQSPILIRPRLKSPCSTRVKTPAAVRRRSSIPR